MLKVTDVVHPTKPQTTGVFVKYHADGKKVAHQIIYLPDKIILKLSATGFQPVGIELPRGKGKL